MGTKPVTMFSQKQSRRWTNVLAYKGRWKSPLAGYLFISSLLLGLIFLTIWPLLQSKHYSFTKFKLLDTPEWV